MSSSKGIDFGQSNLPRVRWVGSVMSWEPKGSFGRQKQVPYPVELSVYASTEDEASYLLSLKAEEEGYALGGVNNIMQVDKPISKKTSTTSSQTFRAPVRRKQTELEKFLAMASPEALALVMQDVDNNN